MKGTKALNGIMVAFLLSTFVLASCGPKSPAPQTLNPQPAPVAPAMPTPPATPPPTDNGQAAVPKTELAVAPEANSDESAMLKDEKDYDWVIYVQDTQKMSGPLKEPITIDLKATNILGGIEGNYTGSATLKFNQTVGEASVTSVSSSNDLNLVVGPYLAPLVNAPKAEDQPDYSGHGTMSLSNVGTGTVAGESKTVSFKAAVSMDLTIRGTQVEMTLKYPMGTVLYHGYIRGEGKK